MHSFATAFALAVVPVLGCAGEQTQAPAQPTAYAATPPETMGRTELQAPSGTVSAPPDDAPPRLEAPASAGDCPLLSGDAGSPALDRPAPAAILGVRPDGTPVAAEAIPELSSAPGPSKCLAERH
jgi:hypothetical protein